jgi:hypothetical protein
MEWSNDADRDGSLESGTDSRLCTGRGDGWGDGCLYLNLWPVVADWKPEWDIYQRTGDRGLC